MRALIQRVKEAQVRVGGDIIGSIGPGLLVLLGVAPEDDEQIGAYLADRCAGLRIFEDEHGKMNRSLTDVNGAMLVISQLRCLQIPHRGGGRISAMPHRRNWQSVCTRVSNVMLPERFRFNAAVSVPICRCRSAMTARLRSCWRRCVMNPGKLR